ncbi:histidine phosphatase family protein [Virgibacillus sp. DJP39]|uniref:histidine phosphatase family protein n=1 Tax=Virgibacillus sp. DJP39 TaxID=3409790 RepID=UPI003BB53BBD
MTMICLVRHGETDWNALGKLQGATDVPLNSKGVQQAEECGVYLKSTTWDIVISSPLQRAKCTAGIIHKTLSNVPLIEMDDFSEKSFGDAEGMNLEERKSTFPDRNYPNQEDNDSFKKRVMSGLEKVNHNYPNAKVLLIAHGAVINSILATLSNGEVGSGKTRLNNACISNIQFIQDQWNVKEINQITHLS